MNIPEIIKDLTAERDGINAAIEALSKVGGPPTITPTPNPSPRIKDIAICKCGRQVSAGQLKNHQKHCASFVKKTPQPCKHGCGKVFTSVVPKEKHEEDCSRVIRMNGSDALPRRTM